MFPNDFLRLLFGYKMFRLIFRTFISAVALLVFLRLLRACVGPVVCALESQGCGTLCSWGVPVVWSARTRLEVLSANENRTMKLRLSSRIFDDVLSHQLREKSSVCRNISQDRSSSSATIGIVQANRYTLRTVICGCSSMAEPQLADWSYGLVASMTMRIHGCYDHRTQRDR